MKPQREPEPLSAFIRLMRAALEEYESAQTPEDKQAAQDHMAMLIRSVYKR